MAKSLTEVAKAILSENANAATLKPKSKSADAPQKLDGKIEDLGGAVETPTDEPASAKAANSVKKDTSKSGKAAVGAEPGKKLTAMAEEMEDEGDLVSEAEELEISEELSDFIEAMIAEGASEEEIAAAIEENFELVSEEVETDEGYEVDMSEDIDALFAGEELSEDFKDKAKTIFEAAVRAKIEEEIARIEDAYAETLEEQIEEIQEELTSNVDNYLNYVVEQWVQDNEVAIESGLRAELTEEFISGLRNLFSEHYIDIPEEKVSVVEEMASKVAELEEKLNEEIERNVSLNNMINESRRFEILVDACEGLTDTQSEKLKSLSEGLDFGSATEFKQKIEVLKESYFRTSVNSDSVLDHVESSTDGKTMIAEDLSGPMAAYVKTLGRGSK